jgi:hypothetical protein
MVSAREHQYSGGDDPAHLGGYPHSFETEPSTVSVWT